MKLQPIKNNFLFKFTSETAGGKFIEKNKGLIILTNGDLDTQGKYARWGKVEEVGPDIVDFKKGDIVLIEALQWTKEIKIEDVAVWKSDDSKVIAIAEDESVIYAY